MVNKRKKVSTPKPNVSEQVQTPPFHICFPYTLTYKEDKILKNCYFQVEEHLKKYIKRYNLKKDKYIISKTEPRE
jgi:hypothetical protein